MTNIISKYSSVKNIVLLFGLILFFNFIIFPISHKSNSELLPLDLQVLYSPEEAYQLLEKYSETERRNYLVGELSVDVIYPIIYSLLLCFSIFLLFENIKLAKLPILILIADYIENLGIVTMIYNYPNKLTSIAYITSVFSTIKWLLVFVSISVILYGLLKKLSR